MCGEQRRALRAIELCRTAALGGYKTRCDHCGHESLAYCPCRNRHCPKCHGVAQAAWLARRQREVLDTPYEHAIFTLPQDLSPLILYQNMAEDHAFIGVGECHPYREFEGMQPSI